jgi:DNA-binding transcriptional regulator YdaS (Cro superfamily)
MTGPHPALPPFALDLDAPPIQQACLRYLSVMGETLRRAADAIEQGGTGRAQAIEELALLQVLCHYLTQRLSEPVAVTATTAAGAGAGEGAGEGAGAGKGADR